MIASTIGLVEGNAGLDDIKTDLADFGVAKGVVGAVTSALVPVSSCAKKGVAMAVPSSGKGSGLVKS